MKKIEFNNIILNRDKYIGRQLFVVYTFFWSRFGVITRITDKCIFYKYDINPKDKTYCSGRITLSNCDIADLVPKEHEVNLNIVEWK